MFLVPYILHCKLVFFQLALQYLCIAQYITQACSYCGICLLPPSLFWNLHRGCSCSCIEEITGFTHGFIIYLHLYLFYILYIAKKKLNVILFVFFFLFVAFSVWPRFFLFLAKAPILQNYFLIILFWMKISNVGSEWLTFIFFSFYFWNSISRASETSVISHRKCHASAPFYVLCLLKNLRGTEKKKLVQTEIFGTSHERSNGPIILL